VSERPECFGSPTHCGVCRACGVRADCWEQGAIPAVFLFPLPHPCPAGVYRQVAAAVDDEGIEQERVRLLERYQERKGAE